MYTKVIHEGKSWIDDTGITQSFEQMSHFLTCEISKCIQTCLHIAYGGEENAQDCSTNEEKTGSSLNNSTSAQFVGTLKVGDDNKNFKKLEEIDTWMTKYSAQLRDLKQRIKRQEKQNEMISSLWKEKTDVKFEGFMKEFHSASDFMSSLQTQTETLNSRNKQHEEKLDNVMKKLTDLEKKTDLTINENLGLVKTEEMNLELDKIKNKLSNTINPLRDDLETAMQKLTDQEENMKTIKSDQESEKVKLQALKEEIEISINMSDVTIQTVRKDIKTLSSESMEQTNFSKKQLAKISSEVDGLLSDLTKLKSLNKKIVFNVGFTTRKVLLANTVAKYDQVIINVGDGYNVNTGVFTCPLAGHYFFQVFIMPDYKESALLGLYQNDECKLYVLGDNPSSTNGNGTVLYLKQFDKICLKSEKGCKLFGWPQKTYNTFTGFLLDSY